MRVSAVSPCFQYKQHAFFEQRLCTRQAHESLIASCLAERSLSDIFSKTADAVFWLLSTIQHFLVEVFLSTALQSHHLVLCLVYLCSILGLFCCTFRASPMIKYTFAFYYYVLDVFVVLLYVPGFCFAICNLFHSQHVL